MFRSRKVRSGFHRKTIYAILDYDSLQVERIATPWTRSRTELWARWREELSLPVKICRQAPRVGARLRSESAPTARAAITACTLGAMFPDIDIFAGPIARNPLAIMEWHRNITHSLVMLPVWALLLAAVSLPLARWAGWKPPSFAMLVGIYAFGIAQSCTT